MEDVVICILCPFGQFPTIWHVLWPFGKFFPRFGTFLPVLVCCTKNNLATLTCTVFRLCWFRIPDTNSRKNVRLHQILAIHIYAFKIFLWLQKAVGGL
jgi:hypothetical protein